MAAICSVDMPCTDNDLIGVCFGLVGLEDLFDFWEEDALFFLMPLKRCFNPGSISGVTASLSS